MCYVNKCMRQLHNIYRLCVCVCVVSFYFFDINDRLKIAAIYTVFINSFAPPGSCIP